MTQFVYHGTGNTEAQERLGLAFLLNQESVGLAADGVLNGLGVTQTTTASSSVTIARGAGVVQDTVLAGAKVLVLDASLDLNVLGPNPMGGLPRNDIIVFDSATLSSGTGGIRAITGTPNASPTDPTVPATAIPLARLRHAASATTIPSSAIDLLAAGASLDLSPAVTFPAPQRSYVLNSAATVSHTSTTWQAYGSTVAITVPAGAPVMCSINLRAWLRGAAGSEIRARLAWSGALTGNSSSFLSGGGFNGMLEQEATTYSQQSLSFDMVLPAGTTTFSVEALRSTGAASPTLAYVGIDIVPIQWASMYAAGTT